MPEVTTQVDPDDSLELNGRELDAAVAVRVMGEPMPPTPVGCPHFFNTLSPQKAWHHVRDFDHGGGECKWEPEPFTTSIEAAMRVVEKMRSEGWHLIISDSDDRSVATWFVDFLKKSNRHLCAGEAGADSLPLAICRAALKALERKK